MYSVGFYYEYGQGVTKDLNKAKLWFARSAAQGFDQAQYKLDRLNQ
jgi:TPR repeat protein